MIKVKVSKDIISITGHANYAEYGKDIVCASVSSVVMTSIEGISIINESALDANQVKDNLIIKINLHDDIIDKLITNMFNCLKEIEKQYPKNIKITNREE